MTSVATPICLTSDPVSSDELATITESNAHNSPLLRLPAELRNRIYRLALSGLHIQITQAGAQCSEKNCTHEDEFKAVCTVSTDAPYPGYDMVKWADTNAARLPLACRQLHAETSIMVYELNTFYCWNEQQLETFAEACNPAQRDAVRTIQVDTMLPHMYLRYMAKTYMDKEVEAPPVFSTMFPKLRRLYMPQLSEHYVDLEGGTAEINPIDDSELEKLLVRVREKERDDLEILPCTITLGPDEYRETINALNLCGD